jgi:glycosyltransferase involved in cell wall biosynthesis
MADTPLRLDYVSPLPPVRSGIADYSVDLLPHLAARADVRLIHLPGQPVDEAVAARWPLVPATETGAGGRLPLYQMGNNRYHEGVRELALRLPGVLTLHDVVLHHLLLDITLGRDEFLPYGRQLAYDHGWVGEAVAMAKRWHAYGETPIFALPAHRALLLAQRGILVHSAWAAGVVREECPEVPVRAIPMGVPLPPPADADTAAGRELRRRLGLPLDAPVLGSFGFQTPIKRTETAITALAAPGLERVHLLIVGEAAKVMDLEGEARRAGVAERVHVAGFLPYEDFAAAIAATDLCLNLRYPTAGETSASLLRVLAAGRPAVVSDYAQFADLPDAVAVKVPLAPRWEDEAAALAEALRRLLAAPERLAAMGAGAREHVRRHHAPESSAEAVIDACREWEHRPPPGADEPALAPPPSSLSWGELPGEIEVSGADLPWPEGERRRIGIRLANRGFARWLAGDRGPGGMAVVVKLLVGWHDLLGEGGRWLPLPRDLAPGEEVLLETEVRRPPGPVRLEIEPHLFGGSRLSLLGGPLWERAL